MKSIAIILLFAAGLAIGFWAGSVFAGQRARAAVLAGPYSDHYGEARSELSQAVTRLQAGDTNVIEHIKAAEGQIGRAQEWSKRFIGLNEGDIH